MNRFISGSFLKRLDKEILSEKTLKHYAQSVRFEDQENVTVLLLAGIPSHGRSYDWNVGSLLQHFNVDALINALEVLPLEKMYNSIGLAWVLGEFGNQNKTIIDYLYAVVKKADNSDAWWRAAFSLENLGAEEAINLLKISLKHLSLESIDYYLERIEDKRSVVSILILSNVESVEQKIYPTVKNTLLKSKNSATIINCCWLLGRLRLMDNEIVDRLVLLSKSKNYELRYYTYFALQHNATAVLKPIMQEAIKDGDPLIRKMAVRGLRAIGDEDSLYIVESFLQDEKEEAVISEMTQAIYALKNTFNKTNLLIEQKSCRNENGMISDDSDKWYSDPAIYQQFSEAEDPENVCLDLVLNKIKDHALINPIDLATGTGRIVWPIVESVRYGGDFFMVDASEKMCAHVVKTIRREKKYTHRINIVNTTIQNAPKKIDAKSSFIISSFGFPSRIGNDSLCRNELKAVYDLLTDDGLFCTIGWDESFNDELNMMWHRFIPDDIRANNFEEWRRNRAAKIRSPRNCHLTWFKRGILVPLQFSNLKESAFVMGYLFGRDAAEYVVHRGTTEWSMSMGITFNTKSDIKQILEKYEGN